MSASSIISSILNSRLLTTVIILACIGLGIMYGINKYDGMKTKYEISTQNNKSLTDSVRLTKTKNEELIFSKQILVAQHQNDLKDLNSEMLREIKKFNGKVHELTTMVGKIKSDTVTIDNTKLLNFPNGDSGIAFEYNKIFDAENSRHIKGYSRFNYDSITQTITPLNAVFERDEIKFNITQGLRTTKEGKIEIFATSRYPDFSVGNLNSVIVDPKKHPALKNFTKKKKLTFGIYGGYGVTANLSTSTVITGPQLGFGAMYRLW